MGLLSFLTRDEATTGADAARVARLRARRRLIGATVLVGLGVLGFPLLFETQPRPIPVDVPIEIPRKDAVPALVAPPSRVAPVPAVDAAAASAPKAETMITESRTDAGREPATPATAPPRAPAAAESAPPAKAAVAARDAKAERPAPAASAPLAKAAVAARDAKAERPAPAASAPPAKAAVAARDAKAEGPVPKAERADAPPPADKPRVAAADAPRMAVQIGAYADAATAREARQRVEKLGLKAYTQVVNTEGGQRIRVRVGPFATRDEADKVAGRIKSAGLPAAVVAL